MNVGDLFQDLSSGELRNLYMGSEGTGIIKIADRDRVIYFANRTLTRLFSRFVCQKFFLELVQIGGRKIYPIQLKYAVSDATVGNTNPRFLIDSLEAPYPDRLVKIIAVKTIPLDEISEPENITLNDTTSTSAVRLLSFDTLQFDKPVAGQRLMLELQMEHPKLLTPADENQRIEVPPMLVEALHLKIAAGIYGSMNGQENVGKSSLLDAQFEGLVQLIEDQDLLQTTTSDDHNRLGKGGWL